MEVNHYELEVKHRKCGSARDFEGRSRNVQADCKLESTLKCVVGQGYHYAIKRDKRAEG